MGGGVGGGGGEASSEDWEEVLGTGLGGCVSGNSAIGGAF